jgi:8-oxo-dGTP pyrophosphatase MutT (NUDIX family)
MNNYDPNYVYKPVYSIVGQKAIVVNNSGKVLIMKRSDKMGPKMQWSLAGGAIEKGEDPEEGIRREIREEAQIEVEKIRPFTSRSYMNNDDFIIILGYVGYLKSGEVTLNWEHTEFAWVPIEEALTYDLTSDGRYFLEKYPGVISE